MATLLKLDSSPMGNARYRGSLQEVCGYLAEGASGRHDYRARPDHAESWRN